MRPIHPIALAVLIAAPATTAAADTALVDSVETYGGLTPERARAHLSRALVAAGFTVRLPEPGATACGPDLSCARRRGREAGVDLVVRAAYVALAGQITVSLQLVDPVTGPREVSAQVGDLETLEPDFVGALRPQLDRRPPTVDEDSDARWWLAGTGVALTAGGVAALLVARNQRQDFFEDFVDENGDIVGISPADAARREQRANRWLAAGYILAGAGLVAGTISIALFSTHEPGVSVRGQF